MPGVDKIAEKIIADAKEQAASAREDAEAKAAGILEQAEHDAKNRAEAITEGAKAEGADIIRRREAVAGLDRRKELLAKKREMIDAAFTAARDKIAKLPDDEYKAFMGRLLADCAESGGTVRIAAADGRLKSGDFLAAAEGVSRGDDDDTIKSGFKFVAADRGTEVNCSVEAVINEMRDSLEAEVCAILFG